MSAATPPQKLHAVDAKEDFGDRRGFTSFEPAGRRATIYEDVTIDTQPSPGRLQYRGFPTRFDDGRTSWQAESTRLRCTDWYAYRDPAAMWERTYYQIGTRFERSIEDSINVARRDGHLGRLDKAWVDWLRDNFQQLAFFDHGVWLLTAVAARDGLSDSVSHCICFEAAMKQRQAQAVVLYAMDLEDAHGDLPIETAKQSWLDDEPWQPARKLLEELRTVTDWAERVVVINCFMEPLIGVLLRRELYLKGCALVGDTILPTLLNVAQLEYQYSRDWTDALVRMLLADAEHGTANAAVLQDWADRWLPTVREAVAALRPVFESGPDGLDFDASVQACEDDLAAILAATGMKVAVAA